MDAEKQRQLKPGFYWVRLANDDPKWEVCQIIKDLRDLFMLSTGDDEYYFFPIDGLEIVGPLTPPAKNWPEVD